MNVSLSGGYPNGRTRRRGPRTRRASAGQRYIRWFFRQYYRDPVYAFACDPGLPPADLDRAIKYLHLAAAELAVLARDYRHAADESARLSHGA